METDKIQSIILGQVLLEKTAFPEGQNILTKSDFVGYHAEIWQSCVDLESKGLAIDLLTVVDDLKGKGILEQCGGAYTIASMTNEVAGIINLESHARILKNRSTMSKARDLGRYLLGLESTGDAMPVIEHIQKSLDSLITGAQHTNSRLLNEIMIDELEARKSRKNGLQGASIGLTAWDDVIGGLYTGVHVVAARPAMGKTAFAVSAAISLTKELPVCIWSGEMTSDKIFLRIESNLSGITTQRLRINNIYPNEIESLDIAHVWASKAPIEVDDTPNINIAQLRVKCMNWKRKHGRFALIMDYLGLMDDGGDEYKGVTFNSKRIHQLANEFDIPIMLLHQLSRSVESRENKIPELSDLRGSGGIEQDADTVTFLYRPHYYGFPNDPITGHFCDPNVAYALIRKNREGDVGEIAMSFHGHRSAFTN